MLCCLFNLFIDKLLVYHQDGSQARDLRSISQCNSMIALFIRLHGLVD